uniref:Uncharacterized protein n=1 Tax=Parascaris equorum TaxID=6256 RepID=A0A914RK84_PAREQ
MNILSFKDQIPDTTCLFLKEIEEKLKSAQLEEKERMKLELEMSDVKRQEEEYLKKEKELEEKERLEPWNVDTIGHEAFSSSSNVEIIGVLYQTNFTIEILLDPVSASSGDIQIVDYFELRLP